MFLTKKLETLNEILKNEVLPDGLLHLGKFNILEDVGEELNIPRTDAKSLKKQMKILKSYGFTPIELLAGLENYLNSIVHDFEERVYRANRWEKFIDEIDEYNFNELDTFICKYHNLCNARDREGMVQFHDRLWIESVIKYKKTKREALSTVQFKIIDLQGKSVFENDPIIQKRIEYFQSEINNIEAFSDKIEDIRPEDFNHLPINDFHESYPNKTSILKWTGKDLELFELIKALIQSKKINSQSEKVTFKTIFNFFGLTYSDSRKRDAIQTIRARVKDKTPFLIDLQLDLENWIEAKDQDKLSR